MASLHWSLGGAWLVGTRVGPTLAQALAQESHGVIAQVEASAGIVLHYLATAAHARERDGGLVLFGHGAALVS